MSDGVARRRVLLTGATGFIGANLAHTLVRRGADVHAPVRPDSDLQRIEPILDELSPFHADLTDAGRLRRAVRRVEPELVFHAAASPGHPRSTAERLAAVRTNVLGTANLLEALEPVAFRRFVHLGSSLAYGPRDEPLRESHPPTPATHRGATKAAATLLVRQFARAGERPVTVLRLFSVYGYHEPPDRLIPTAIRAVLDDRELPLTAPGYRRDLIFIDDVVDACLPAAATACAPGTVINIGSGRQWANEEVVRLIGRVAGATPRVRTGDYPPSPSDTTHWVADIDTAAELLGWEPRHDLRTGLEKTVAWVRERRGVRAESA